MHLMYESCPWYLFFNFDAQASLRTNLAASPSGTTSKPGFLLGGPRWASYLLNGCKLWPRPRKFSHRHRRCAGKATIKSWILISSYVQSGVRCAAALLARFLTMKRTALTDIISRHVTPIWVGLECHLNLVARFANAIATLKLE